MPERDPIWRFTREERIAYFSMEIGLDPELPTYSGGLGMLAGDALRSAADLDIPIVGVTLASRAGYFRQTLTPEGEQAESPDIWDPAAHTEPLMAGTCVELEGRTVWVRGWLYVVRGSSADLPVILLDTDLPENHGDDRALTHRLYGGDSAYRLKQEAVLGLGGARLLQALGFRLRRYHMNEGHAALLTLQLLRDSGRPQRFVRAGEPEFDVQRVRELCAFTTHTPVEAGHDRFDYGLVSRLAPGLSAREHEVLRMYGGPDALNLTRLGLNMSQYVNGVAESHAVTSRQMFPTYSIHAITNGVHAPTWTHPALAALFDAAIPRWRHEPEALVRADSCLGDGALWDAHVQAKAELVAELAKLGARIDPASPILCFARRMTSYKRPDLLFSDLERLRAIARRFPFQLVIAGKAHPQDGPGKALIRTIHGQLRALAPVVPAFYVPNYDMRKAKLLVAGSDVWLNTPQPPLEASGTSGMKAACNGVPSLSVLDGWWLEGHIEGVTGWAIGDRSARDPRADAAVLYQKLEDLVLPLYHQNRRGWTAVMKGAISKCASLFSSHRMMRRYAVDAYLH
jgi:starch phosphorylase